MAMRAVALLALLCGIAAVTPVHKVDKLALATPLSRKVATELNVVAKVLQEGVKGIKHEEKPHAGVKKVVEQVSAAKHAEDGKKEVAVNKTQKAAVNKTQKDKKFPWWNMPNFTAVKKEANKTEKGIGKVANVKAMEKEANAGKEVNKTHKDKKFPYWANASAMMPNFTAKTQANKTQKAAGKISNLKVAGRDTNKTKNDTKFPWWNMPNFTAAKKENKEEKEVNKTKKPTNASAKMPNTAVKKEQKGSEKHLNASLPKGVPQFTELGPFASKEAACDYCFTSHTRTSVVPNCICTAYDGDNGPTMFCTGTDGGLRYVQERGGCKCTENNPSAQGQTTCDPF